MFRSLRFGVTLMTLGFGASLAACNNASGEPGPGGAGLPNSTPLGGAGPQGGAAVSGSGGSISAGGGATAGDGGAAGASAGGAGASAGGAGAGAGLASDLPVPPGAANLPEPSGAPGGLTILSWAGFEAAVSYTFDDTNSSQIEQYDVLNALGVRFTFYLITGRTELSSPVWKDAVAAGHELGNHTHSHLESDDGADTDEATQRLEETFDIKVWTMAAPYGAGGYVDVASTRFLANRGVANGLVAPNDNTDPFSLPCYIPAAGASTATMDEQVTSARDEGKWRLVLVHGFTGGSDGAYQPVALQAFTDAVDHAKAFGDLWIDSVVNIAAYWRAEKLLNGTTPTTAGGVTTWTWTLPEHFPPSKFLRVRVTGGTLEQNGKELVWDAHGYYEVALDAASLTLKP